MITPLAAAVLFGARHLDFLRSTQRCIRAPQISGFWRLELFGIPWILSFEMGLFNGLRATRGQFYFHHGPFLGDASKGPAVIDPKVDRAELPRRAERLGALMSMAVDIVKGPIGHWEQTNAVFSFWQEIVDLAPVLQNFGARSRGRRGADWRLNRTQFALDPRFRGDDRGVALGLSGPFQGSHVSSRPNRGSRSCQTSQSRTPYGVAAPCGSGRFRPQA